MMMFMPTDAPTPESAAAALPVLAVLTVWIPAPIAPAPPSHSHQLSATPFGFPAPSPAPQPSRSRDLSAIPLDFVHRLLARLALNPMFARLAEYHKTESSQPVMAVLSCQLQ